MTSPSNLYSPCPVPGKWAEWSKGMIVTYVYIKMATSCCQNYFQAWGAFRPSYTAVTLLWSVIVGWFWGLDEKQRPSVHRCISDYFHYRKNDFYAYMYKKMYLCRVYALRCLCVCMYVYLWGCEFHVCDVKEDYSIPDSKVDRQRDMYKASNKNKKKISRIYCNTISPLCLLSGPLKPTHPDRLITLSELTDMDK